MPQLSLLKARPPYRPQWTSFRNWGGWRSSSATASANPGITWYATLGRGALRFQGDRGCCLREAIPQSRRPGAEDFSGGEATVVPLLQSLGFEVHRIGEDWSEDEVQSTVADYFEMLRLEADGLAYNKSEHNQMLRKQLNGRSKASVELKHQNISAVLTGLGLPFIQGYKPRGNSQLLLRKAVQEYVIQHSVAVGKIVDALEEVKPRRRNLIQPYWLILLPRKNDRSLLCRRLFGSACRASSTTPPGTKRTAS